MNFPSRSLRKTSSSPFHLPSPRGRGETGGTPRTMSVNGLPRAQINPSLETPVFIFCEARRRLAPYLDMREWTSKNAYEVKQWGIWPSHPGREKETNPVTLRPRAFKKIDVRQGETYRYELLFLIDDEVLYQSKRTSKFRDKRASMIVRACAFRDVLVRTQTVETCTNGEQFRSRSHPYWN